MFNNLDQILEMRQDGTAHENGNLLYDFDARVSSLPGLLALTDGLEERQEGGDSQGGGHHSEGPGGGVTDVLVQVVNVRPHCGDHGGQTSSLNKM